MELGPDARRLLGGWRLVSAFADGKPTYARGMKPTGILFYDATGWMSVHIQGDHPPLELAPGAEPTAEQALHQVKTYNAYFGTYSVDEVAKIVIHHRTGSVNPGWQRHPDYVRVYAFDGDDRVILRPVNNRNELVWQRLK